MNSGLFDSWMNRVDDSLDEMCGMDTACLPDCDYWNWWNGGMEPKEAAILAIENAGGY